MANKSDLKIGVLLSAGGSAFTSAFDLSGFSKECFHVITDRACGAEGLLRDRGIVTERVSSPDRTDFSEAVAKSFRRAGCDLVLLHFSRLVSDELYDSILTCNVHPSLLPAFPGLDGVGDAARAFSLFQGATLHVVDGGVDTGPIIAQTCCAVPFDADLAWRHHLGFVQKVLVTLSLFDLCASGRIDPVGRGGLLVNRQGLAQSTLLNPDFFDLGMRDRALRFAAGLYDLGISA
jgi:phosphoribosylglycinamide formyltransferase 1